MCLSAFALHETLWFQRPVLRAVLKCNITAVGMGNVEHLTVPEQNRIRSTRFLYSLESVTRYILFQQYFKHTAIYPIC